MLTRLILQTRSFESWHLRLLISVCFNLRLKEKLLEGTQHVSVDIEIIMCHVWSINKDLGLTNRSFCQLLSVVKRYHFVLATVQDKSGALCSRHLLDVLKALWYEDAEPAYRVSRHSLNWRVSWHETKCSRIEGSCEEWRRAGSHGPTKDYDVWFLDAHIMQAELVHVFGIFLDFLFWCWPIPLVDTIARVLHTKDTHVAIIWYRSHLTHSESQALCVPVKVEKQLWWCGVVEVNGRNECASTGMHLLGSRLLFNQDWFGSLNNFITVYGAIVITFWLVLRGSCSWHLLVTLGKFCDTWVLSAWWMWTTLTDWHAAENTGAGAGRTAEFLLFKLLVLGWKSATGNVDNVLEVSMDIYTRPREQDAVKLHICFCFCKLLIIQI